MSETTVNIGRELYPWEKEILEHGQLYLVGGWVRDRLLGEDNAQIDEDYIVRGLSIEGLLSILQRFGKTNLVGKSFGVIKFRADATKDKVFDISMPRKERSTGLHHRDFDVRFDPDLPVEVDLERRDFTINSMAVELPTGKLIDPLGGFEDLQKKILRVNREESFLEDPLRILRGVQFYARFGLKIDGDTLALMKKYAVLIQSVSPERIRDELDKLLTGSAKPSVGFLLMHEIGLLALIIPELDVTYGVEQNEFHPDDLFMHSLKTCDEIAPMVRLRWSALLHDIGKRKMKKTINGRVVFYGHQEESARTAADILKRFRYPTRIIEKVRLLILHHMFNLDEESSDSAIGRFIRKIGRENLDDILALRKADLASRGEPDAEEQVDRLKKRMYDYLEKQNAFSVKDLQIDGNDVMNILGLDEGPEVGKVLKWIFEKVCEDNSLNEREKLLKMIREYRV